jgi:TIR domain/Pentapeptide repeats (8 copies)
MANDKHVAKLKEGGAVWNEWWKAHPKTMPNLRKADLEGVDLSDVILNGVDLFRANLRHANLSNANLVGADLHQASLDGANLKKADLVAAQLPHTDLRRADFRQARLIAANFISADLTGADFSGAYLGGTVFGNVDLSTVRGLKTVRHWGPSTIGINVIYRSLGKIPEAFLRGAGVPDNFLTYLESLAANPIEFYSCFISYSTKDQDFAERLHADLQSKGVRCWFAPDDIQGGRKTHEQIDQAIRMHERLLLILSAHSMGSEWVKTEIAKARKREVQEGKKVLFPVSLVPFGVIRDWECFDADTGKDSAREIREYFIPDFSNWKDRDSYQSGFSRLLRDLKAQDGKQRTVNP